MDEIPAFSRRHTPRHSVNVTSSHATVDYMHDDVDVVLLSARDRLDALSSAHTSGANSAVSVIETPRSNSKTRKHAAVPSSAAPASSPSATIVKAVKGHTGTSRKMSGAQLRVFFLLCVALYFAVICFADDIVKFAQWVGEDDNAAAWKAAIATTPTSAPTKAALDTRAAGANGVSKDAVRDVTKKPIPSDEGETITNSTATNTETKKGNLRGEEAATREVATAIPAETKASSPPEAETPAVLVKKETDAKVNDVMTSPPQDVNADDKKSEITATDPDMSKPSDSQALVDGHQADDKHAKAAIEKSSEQRVVDDTHTHKIPVDDDQDAPLDSLEERERETRVDVKNPTTKEVVPTIEALAAPGEVPKTAARIEVVKHQAATEAEEHEAEAATTQPIHNDDGAKDPDAAR